MHLLNGYRFWEWFSENHKRYLQLDQLEEDEISRLANELNEQLDKYCTGLGVEIRLNKPGAKDFIISANGDMRYFEQAEDLAFMAPKPKEWNIIALQPAVWEYPIAFEYKGRAVTSEQLWFSTFESVEEPHKLGIVVYFEHYDADEEDEFYLPAANKMLDFILGEKAGRLDVPYLQVNVLPEQPDPHSILPLETLPEYIEMWKEQVVLN